MFAEWYGPPPRLLVYGAVDTAESLCRGAKLLGWTAIVADARATFLTPERIPSADLLIPKWPEEAIAEMAPDHQTAIVVLTHDDKFDEPALIGALETEAFYIGALGSRRNQERRRERLLEAGVAEEALERIQGPCGLDIGADTQEETALSILGEILAVRAGRGGGPLRSAKQRIHVEVDVKPEPGAAPLRSDRPGLALRVPELERQQRPQRELAERRGERAAGRRRRAHLDTGVAEQPAHRRLARGACQEDVTTTTSRAPTRSTSLSALTAFSTVVRASGSTTSSARRAAPGRRHQLGLRAGVVPARPPGEHDDVVGRRDLGRRREPCGADRVQLAGAAVRVAEHDDDALHERRRAQPAEEEQRPDHGDDELDRLLALQLRLAALRAPACAPATSSTRRPASFRRSSASTSGAPLTYGSAITGIAFAFDRSHPARRVVERAAEPDVHRLLQEADPEAARGARLVAIGARSRGRRRSASRRRRRRLPERTRSSRRRSSSHRMLAVGVDAAAVGVAAFVRLAVARRDAGAQTAVLAERDDVRAVRASDGGGRVGRAVVDHEHVRVGKLSRQLLEHRGEVRLLVPGGDEDDRVVRRHAPSVARSGRTAGLTAVRVRTRAAARPL